MAWGLVDLKLSIYPERIVKVCTQELGQKQEENALGFDAFYQNTLVIHA